MVRVTVQCEYLRVGDKTQHRGRESQPSTTELTPQLSKGDFICLFVSLKILILTSQFSIKCFTYDKSKVMVKVFPEEHDFDWLYGYQCDFSQFSELWSWEFGSLG